MKSSRAYAAPRHTCSARSTRAFRAAPHTSSTGCAPCCASSAIRKPNYPTIHVGGTSGKGSTATMIAAALQAAGKRTGLHTKPHLRSMTERARIDGDADSARTLRRAARCDDAGDRADERAARTADLLRDAAGAVVRLLRRRARGRRCNRGRASAAGSTERTSCSPSSRRSRRSATITPKCSARRSRRSPSKRPASPSAAFRWSSRRCRPPARRDRTMRRRGRRAGRPCRDVVRVESGSPEPARRQTLALRTAANVYRVAMPVLGIFQRANAATAIAVLEQLAAELRPDGDAVERGFAHFEIAGTDGALCGHARRALRHRAQRRESRVAGRIVARKLPRAAHPLRRRHWREQRRAANLENSRRLPATFTFTSFAVPDVARWVRRASRPWPNRSVAGAARSTIRSKRSPSRGERRHRRHRRRDRLDVRRRGLREWFAPTAV